MISKITDIGHVKADETEEILHEVKNAQIVAVSHLHKHKACLKCKARVEPSSMEGFGRCSKPEGMMMQKLDFCSNQISVKLLVMVDGRMHSLSAYGKIVTELAGVVDVTDQVLLMLPPLTSVTYNDGNIITSFLK